MLTLIKVKIWFMAYVSVISKLFDWRLKLAEAQSLTSSVFAQMSWGQNIVS